HRVFVHGDTRRIQRLFRSFTREILVAQVDQHQVRVGTARDNLIAALHERGGQSLRVRDYLFRILSECRLSRFLQRHRLGGYDVLERTTLQTREYRLVDRLRVDFFREDQSPARTTQRFVRRRGDDIRMGDRRRVDTGRDKTGDVRHVYHEIGADFFRNVRERGKIQRPCIRAGTCNDHLGPLLARQRAHSIHVDDALIVDAVVNGLVQNAREVDWRAVREMTALGEIQAEERLTRLHQGKEDRL